jgi:ABC-type branched-subunit amino acid transport system ATPase component
VRENVELARVAGGRGGDGVRDALEEVGLGGDVELEAGVLAQGERKRLELAMVLAGEPRVCCWMSRRRGWVGRSGEASAGGV